MLCSLALFLGLATAGALQLAPAESGGMHEMQAIMLDEKEVASRGSHCLDGSTPGFFHKPGSYDGHWVFWLKGGGVCVNKTDCIDYLPVQTAQGSMDSMPLHEYGVFASYHHVLLPNCDLGLYLGDSSEPVTQNGQSLYFQGARIVKHVIDTLSANYSMTDVLFSGGSGGGQSLFVGADYFKSIMPKSVTRFGVVPINGWYAEGGIEKLEDLYTLAGMETTIAERCKMAHGKGERYNCVDPATSYKYLNSNVFMVQIFDYTFQWSSSDELTAAWYSCLESQTPQCKDNDVELLQEHLDNFTHTLKMYPKYPEHGQGGYLSTCTEHTFYNDDTFNQYANNGVTVGAAIEKWWMSIGTNPPATWYLPCSLGTSSHVQCESSC